MTLFDGQPMEYIPKQQKSSKVIISASRMTDMPKFYPKSIIEEVNLRLKKGVQIHTLVLWTKHPKSLLLEPLYSYLNELKRSGVQLFIQLTITGLGGKTLGYRTDGRPLILEPGAPDYLDAVATIPRLIELTGNPERIRLRVDPIIRIRDYRGKLFSSLKMLPTIIDLTRVHGLKHYSFSFLEEGMHQKVDRRFEDLGCKVVSPSEKEREAVKLWLVKLEKKYEVFISTCCVPGFGETKCIDGDLLKELHDNKENCDLKQPKKRDLCGCTNSIDIGGWPPKKCFTGCDYCYANAMYR